MKPPGRYLLVVIGVVLCGLLASPAVAQSIDSMKEQVARLQAENATLQAKATELEAALAATMAARQQAMADQNRLRKMVAEYQNQIEMLRKEAAMSAQVRDKQMKQIVALQDELAAVRNSATPKPRVPDRAAEKPPEDAVPKVDGVVLNVPGGRLVEIAIGSDDGLKKGHRLQVYRQTGTTGLYVGDIEILKTAPDRAVGKLLPGGRDARKGDRVTSRL